MLPRMRTVEQCVEEIKKQDPKSCVSVHFIRNLCKTGVVKHFMSGTKVYVNENHLHEVLGFQVAV